jgi:hypothetical protein
MVRGGFLLLFFRIIEKNYKKTNDEEVNLRKELM